MKKEIIHMSLSDLLKKSAMQICYLRKNKDKEPEPTKKQLEGNEAHIAKAESKLIEMRGTYIYDELKDVQLHIHYSFDEIVPNDVACLFIEHKNITDGSTIELWYRNSCLLQTATYQAFAEKNPNTVLTTATFHVNQGNEKLYYDIKGLYPRSELHLNDIIYNVITLDAQQIVNYMLSKATATLEYETAKEWDKKNKFKDFDNLHQAIKYNNIQQSNRVTIK